MRYTATPMTRLTSVTAALLARFRRQRPLRGGSLLVTLFGDAIAPRGGAVALSSLIRLAAPFGLNERLVRTAMTRLTNDGWFTIRRLGRLSEYRLSKNGQQRFAAATRHIYGIPDLPWQRHWTLVLLPPGRAPQRQAARDALHWAGFGEPVPGLFAHPAPAALEPLLLRTPALRTAIILTTAAGPADTHRKLAELGWDLNDLTQRYRRFLSRFEPVRQALSTNDPPPLASYVIRTLLIHEYRKIHLRDPLLPFELLPPDWIGLEAYALCRSLYGRVVAPAEQYLSDNAATIEGPLPQAYATLRSRFGGSAIIRPTD
jgi:phenylacetic acid degradation operon negative regulatory protein